MEVVSETEDANVRAIEIAKKLDVNYLIGGTFVSLTLPLIKDTKIKYFPYIGKVVGHPCVLKGEIREILDDAKRVEELGVDGINLLAYRYTGDPETLMMQVVKYTKLPVIIAGSINSVERIRKVKESGAWASQSDLQYLIRNLSQREILETK